LKNIIDTDIRETKASQPPYITGFFALKGQKFENLKKLTAFAKDFIKHILQQDTKKFCCLPTEN